MREIILPIILEIDNCEIIYCDSIEVAVSIMEPEDAEEGVFKAYDAVGKSLSLEVKYKKPKTYTLLKPFLFMTKPITFRFHDVEVSYIAIELKPDYLDKSDYLEAAIEKYLKERGVDASNKTLSELVRLLTIYT